jgi:hypothetical protein
MIWLLAVCILAARFPHDVLDLVFAVGAQVFSKALPVKTCETAPEMASQPVFGWLNSSFADNAGGPFLAVLSWCVLHSEGFY